ncbi:MAG: NAD-dependent epimerase/dehydratase family protein [Candidatus Methylomirabilia bacterium]
MSAPAATGAGVLVTGGTGYFGARLVQALRARGERVRVLARPGADTTRLAALGVGIVRGDVTVPATLAAAFEGTSVVIHAAGKVSDWGPRQEFFRVNAQGTANVVAACRAAGVRRLVHLGSLTVLGLPRGGGVVDETTAPAAAPGDAYTASRLSGERVVRAAHGEGGLETVVVRCGLIWGPGEPLILPRILALLRRGRMVRPGGGFNHLGLAYVDNLVHGVILAATVPAAAGGLYHVTDGEDVTCREVLDAIAAALGVPPPRRSVPFRLVYAIAALLEWAAKAVRSASPPPLTRYGARLVACDCRYDIGRARRELGYRPPVSFREGVARLAPAKR